MKIKNILKVLVFAFILTSCEPMISVIPAKTNVPIPTFMPVSTLTLTLFPLMPTITPTTIPTTKAERWMEYENAAFGKDEDEKGSSFYKEHLTSAESVDDVIYVILAIEWLGKR